MTKKSIANIIIGLFIIFSLLDCYFVFSNILPVSNIANSLKLYAVITPCIIEANILLRSEDKKIKAISSGIVLFFSIISFYLITCL
ncbi:hypothetical protein SAMN05216249_11383 [Acetitomaculum ruminis DSM 5522]|uniref:Uncharacterized protein n=1 Tax=Acetitomaculum ruminis DSM 5522 TaxID=1120918 RepID=A0A1I0ZAZ0_9FIRM|nr:hypothetical protein [Acetitomaculum ruminis]SFB21730.1 hypothetical protein SAMN05216249_11383 [Acetitomaculum ruminis DSM 5522]